ncbi:MAG TPA: pyridoxal-phosphate dependent enzyme [Planctomycetota bacterium]|nr:pyridoxal-phosphate dependent enzyme [Planctomycetota bacterium]
MAETKKTIYGPTFAEMRDPSRLPASVRQRALKAFEESPLDPINLFNITWKDERNRVRHLVLPDALTGVRAKIVVLLGRHFPTGSHKVGAGYSILVEKQLQGLTPGSQTAVFPSTGNFGIGGAWVGPRMGYRSLVVLPEDMSKERFEKIKGYGAEVIATPGCESNVKEIYDKVNELAKDRKNKILNQFAELGNYRFHFAVTGEACLDLARDLQMRKIGNGKVAAFVSAMGSAGTIAAGDRIKQQNPSCAIVGLEPTQCPTLYNVGFGGHRIEGIGDKHVTWIHNVMNMDYLMCVDDQACLEGLSVVQEGHEWLGVEEAASLRDCFGVSGICNVLGAIKTAKVLGLGPSDVIVTVATDGFDRYPSVLEKLRKEIGPVTRDAVLKRMGRFHHATTDWVQEGSRSVRERWHNQKYFTWVEQQGKTVDELRALADPAFWTAEQAKIDEIDRKLVQARGPIA